MSGKSSSGLAKRVSQIKQRVSSMLSPPSPLFPGSSSHLFHSPKNDKAKPGIPAHHDLTPTPHADQPIPNVSAHSVANPIPIDLYFKASTFQGRFPAHAASSFTPPLAPEHVSTLPGPSSYGAFNHAHSFTVQAPVFIENTTTDNTMKDLLQHTIIGAGHDSAARNPPPRCHPRTRVSIIQRCLDFIVEHTGEEKLRWVVGPAGVGKSAVMQYIAENPPDGIICASVFLSFDGRHDGTKIIATIAYQLAVKCEPYRQFIQNEISRDPDLPQKALSVQFEKFIIEPFIRHGPLNSPKRFLILIDGIDECDDPLTQTELLEQVTNFCMSYTTSPFVWIVASRPEPHIASFFDEAEVVPAYIPEKITIDSEEACKDVGRYLYDELNKVKLASPFLKHKSQWPVEHKLTKIATAAGGLFAFASAVVRYISSPSNGNPITLLNDVLAVIEGTRLRLLPGKAHPLDHLDALYRRIVSNIRDSHGGEQDTRELLLLSMGENQGKNQFRLQCNLLRLDEGSAYDAVHHIYSVVKVPHPDNVDEECLGCFHHSFEHYLSDFERSQFFRNARDEAEELATQVSLRVIEEVPVDSEAMASGNSIACEDGGNLKGSPDACTSIFLSWPGDERFKLADDQLKLMMYRNCIADVASRFKPGGTAFENLSCFRVLTTRFTAPGSKFRHYELQCFAFDYFRRELTELGILKQVPLRALDNAAICGGIDLRVTSSAGAYIRQSDPLNPSCKHKKQRIDDLMGRQGWTTRFGKSPPIEASVNQDSVGNNADTLTSRFNCLDGNSSHGRSLLDQLSSEAEHCHHCFQRLSLLLANHPDQLATVFVDSTDMCYVELSMDDPDDEMLQFRYRFCHSRPPTCNDV